MVEFHVFGAGMVMLYVLHMFVRYERIIVYVLYVSCTRLRAVIIIISYMVGLTYLMFQSMTEALESEVKSKVSIKVCH